MDTPKAPNPEVLKTLRKKHLGLSSADDFLGLTSLPCSRSMLFSLERGSRSPGRELAHELSELAQRHGFELPANGWP